MKSVFPSQRSLAGQGTASLRRPRAVRVAGRLAHLLLVLVPVLISCLPGAALAAWAVYADSWTSPTEAQTQAMHINRRLSISSATYERATVHGRVFWRVRVAVCATRTEGTAVRQQLERRGISDSWMREVSDSLLPRAPAAPAPAPTATARQDTARADSVVVSVLDSLSHFTRRRLDSLQTLNEERLTEVLGQMRGQLRQELLHQVEQARATDRQTYVTQAEQAQMTRALLDEMNANLEYLTDSLRREAERSAYEDIDVSGSVTARSGATFRRNEYADGERERLLWDNSVDEVFLSFGWSGEATEAVAEAIYSGGFTLGQAYVMVTLDAADSVAQCIGVGIFDTPYGIESVNLSELLAPTRSDLADLRLAPGAGLCLVPWQSDFLRFLVLPYGHWDEDNQRGLAILEMTWPNATLQLTGGGSRTNSAKAATRDVSFGEDRAQAVDPVPGVGTAGSDMVHGDVAFRYDGSAWTFGIEGLYTRRSEPTDPYGVLLEGTVEDMGGMLLVHRRFSPMWGWTLRGDLLEHREDWTSSVPAELFAAMFAPKDRAISATTGPSFTLVDGRLRISCAYTFRHRQWRPTATRDFTYTDFDHSFAVSMTHSF